MWRKVSGESVDLLSVFRVPSTVTARSFSWSAKRWLSKSQKTTPSVYWTSTYSTPAGCQTNVSADIFHQLPSWSIACLTTTVERVAKARLPRPRYVMSELEGTRRSRGRRGLVWPRSAIGLLLQHSVVAAICFFYSKNILSAAVRAVISF
jgi:hypothetical protein